MTEQPPLTSPLPEPDEPTVALPPVGKDQPSAALPHVGKDQPSAALPHVGTDEPSAALSAVGPDEPTTTFVEVAGDRRVLAAPPEPATPPSSDAAAVPDAERDRVTCPECGATQDVHLNRREAIDFCRSCDFPLFWTPSEVIRERGGLGDGEGLRRLPGTVGRSTLASMACPHCAELNLVTAVDCIRCGKPMHPVVELPPPPPPEPVYIPPPPPEPVESGVPWWVWALIGAAAVAVIVVVILIFTHVIG